MIRICIRNPGTDFRIGNCAAEIHAVNPPVKRGPAVPVPVRQGLFLFCKNFENYPEHHLIHDGLRPLCCINEVLAAALSLFFEVYPVSRTN